MDRLEQYIRYIANRRMKEFTTRQAIARAKLEAELSRNGISDADQAFVWTRLAAGLEGGSFNIGNDFYGKNTVPLTKSAARLRVKSAPPRIPKADLDEVDRCMARFLAFEPQVLRMIDQMLAIEGRKAAIWVQERKAAHLLERNRITYSIGLPMKMYPLNALDTNTESSAKQRQEVAPVSAQAYEYSRQIGKFSDEQGAIYKAFKTMNTVFMVEIGQRAAPPPPAPAPLPPEDFPAEAVVD